jgi:hypothetical protein
VRLLEENGVSIAKVDYFDGPALARACSDGTCVVSALAGLGDVILDAQSQLLDAAVKAGVPRFIPSDFAIDFTKLPDGSNRNLDLRRKFHERLDNARIAATSVMSGMFTDLLTGPAPVILFKRKRVVYWENPDQLMDFTTIDNVAEFTAAVALDPVTPRFLEVAGDQISARGIAEVMSDLEGERFKLFRAGGLGRLAAMIRIMRFLIRGGDDLYPPWQGMQYLHNMFSGVPKLDHLDNDRYPGIEWTTVREYLRNAA